MAFILIPIMAVVAYLLGSLSAAIIVSRYFGMDDPRTYGSGNPGASNMLRSGNKKAAALTLVGDALKGLIAVLLAKCLQSMFDLGDGIVAIAAIAAVVGHMWPLFFHFKGGKGVATALGVMLGMSFWTAAWAVAIWLFVATKFKKSSLAALIAAACAPFISFIVQGHHPKLSWALFLVAILVLYRHKENIQRLRSGNELHIGEAARPLKDGKVQTSDEVVVDKAIEDELASIKEEIEKAEEFVETSVKDGVELVVEKTKENVEQITTKAKETVEQTQESIEQVVETTVQKAKETAKQVKETAQDVAQEAVENVKTDIDKAIHKHDTEVAQTAESAPAEASESAPKVETETAPVAAEDSAPKLSVEIKTTRGRKKK